MGLTRFNLVVHRLEVVIVFCTPRESCIVCVAFYFPDPDMEGVSDWTGWALMFFMGAATASTHPRTWLMAARASVFLAVTGVSRWSMLCFNGVVVLLGVCGCVEVRLCTKNRVRLAQ